MSKTNKVAENESLQDEFLITKEEAALMERVREGKEPSRKFNNLTDLLDEIHSKA